MAVNDGATGDDADVTRDEADDRGSGITRKDLLRAGLVIGSMSALVGGAAVAAQATPSGQSLEPTPTCDDGDDPTPPQMEGPYFKPNSPQRTSLVSPSTPGTRLTVLGHVFGLQCQPLGNVLMDFWQADTNGAYDNVGYQFRGHQFTDAQGAFRLETIVPGLYPGRTRHIHVKAQAPGRPVLTTQLYFPGEPRNNTDSLFDPRLLMTVRQSGPVREATFDFVLNVTGPGPTTSPTTPPPGGGDTWQPGVTYNAGDRVTYGGRTYQCLQGHTAVTGWEPPNVPALWQPV